MITVAILINGQPLVAKNAINTGKVNRKGQTKYINDAGETVWHDRTEGAVDLAVKLLRGIKNEKVRGNYK